MKKYIFLTAAAFIWVFTFAFIIFSYGNGELTGIVEDYPKIYNSLAGFAVLEDIKFLEFSSENFTRKENSTREEALKEIKDSYSIREELKQENFTVNYINDLIIEEERILKILDYAEKLAGNASEQEKSEARKYLELTNWKNVEYGDVFIYSEEIKARKKQAFEIYDYLGVMKSRIKSYENSGIDISTAKEIYNEAEKAFNDERYSESQKLMIDIRNELENKYSDYNALNQLKENSINFIAKYWNYILGILFITGIAFYFGYKKIYKHKLKKKIKKLKAEKTALIELEKKTQEDRFNKFKISGIVYNIRMNQYKKRLAEIERDIPVYENKLRKI